MHQGPQAASCKHSNHLVTKSKPSRSSHRYRCKKKSQKSEHTIVKSKEDHNSKFKKIFINFLRLIISLLKSIVILKGITTVVHTFQILMSDVKLMDTLCC